MSLKTDHAFHIGEQHRRTGKPNQDYALSGLLDNGTAYAIVSDGCSSGGMTDIGSRLMVLATKRAIEDCAVTTNFFKEDETAQSINNLRDEYLLSYSQALQLEPQDLLATSLWAIGDQDSVLVHLTGDGVIGVQYEYDLWTYQFEWDQNAPYYPAYKLGDLDAQFVSAHADNPEPLTLIESGTAPTGMGGVPDGFLSEHTVEEGMSGWTARLIHPKKNTGREEYFA